MSDRVVHTGDPEDPAFYYGNALKQRADVEGEKVRRAKDDLAALPRLASPPSYVAARATAEALQPSALLDAAHQSAFTNAVALAKAAYEAIP